MSSRSTSPDPIASPQGVACTSFIHLFEEQVRRLPDHPALACGDEQWTYERLNQASNRLAHLLREAYGVEKESLVGILADRSPWTVVAMLAVWKAGGAFVPVDPRQPAGRIAYIVHDTRLTLLLTQSAFLFNLPELPCPLFALDLQVEGLETPATNPDVTRDGTEAAYVIYTSGTTGRPKGVLIEAASLVNYVQYVGEQWALGPADSVLLLSSPAFDLGYTGIFGSLGRGGTLHLRPESFGEDPETFFGYLVRHRISFLKLTPSLFYMLTHLPGFETQAGQLALRLVVLGGEPVKCEDMARYWQYGPATRFVNHYGPTETTIGTLTCPIDAATFGAFSKQPVLGKPIRNSRVLVLDNHRKAAPVGVPGELYVGGAGVARGYLNNPELTHERFVHLPLLPGSRLYRTGDFGKWLATGNIAFLGRKDQQIKVRGYRVETEEVRKALLGYPAVTDALVLPRAAPDGTTQLVAYVVSPAAPEPADLRAFLARTLPDYMIPAFTGHLDKIPVTANGKLDAAALPNPAAAGPPKPSKAPATELEAQLAGIWSQVLGRTAVGTDENFFEIGGDSIKAIQVASRMHQLQYKLEVKDLFQHLTIGALAREIKPLQRQASQTPVTGLVPLTPIQARFFDGRGTGRDHYNQSVMLYAAGGFDPEAVRFAFTEIVKHHDLLRATFRPHGDGVRQEIGSPAGPVPLQVVDLRGEAEPRQALFARADALQGSLHLAHGPLLKLGLYRLDDGDRLLIVVHHLVVDGVSWRILFEDFGALYRQHREGLPAALPPKTDSFREWAEKLRQFADSPAFLREKAYWAGLAAHPVPPIPYDLPDPGKSCIRDTRKAAFQLAPETTRQLLNEVNRAFRTTIKDVLLTALGLAVKETFGNGQVCLELEGHGREGILADVDVSRTVGWFTSKYPVRLDLAGDDLARCLVDTKEALRRIPNNGVGYGILRYLTSPGHRDGVPFGDDPQISFNYLGQFDTDVARSTFGVAPEPAGNQTGIDEARPYDLEISGLVAGGQLSMSVYYSTRQFHAATIERLAASYCRTLEEIIRFCRRKTVRRLTPSDLLYGKLTVEQLDGLVQQYAGEEIEDVYPLSPMQEGLYYHRLLDHTSTAYFNQTAYRVRGKLQPERVRESLCRLFARYDVFRAAFTGEGLTEPVQVIFKSRQPGFRYCDFRHLLGVTEREEALQQFKAQDRRQLPDLGRDVLVRVTVIQLGEAEFELIWNDHHILKDGWSMGIIMPEFIATYSALVGGGEPQLPPLPPYRKYLEWLGRQDQAAGRQYWAQYLEGYEAVAGVSLLRTGPSGAGAYRKAEEGFVFDEDTTARLHQLARQCQVTLNTVIQTAWGLFMARYNGTADLVFGSVVSGRPAAVAGIESMVGLFINTIPVRVPADPAATFGETARRVQEAAVRGEGYHYLSLAEIQAASPLRQQLFDHIVIFDNYPVAGQLAGMNGQVRPDDNRVRVQHMHINDHAHYDFSVVLGPGKALSVKFDYNAAVFDPAAVRSLAAYFRKAVGQLLAHPERRWDQVALTDTADLALAGTLLTGPPPAPGADRSVLDRFAAQAEKNPGHLAVAAGPHAWTYRELDELSNRLAHCLRTEHGVRAGTPVGLWLDKSAWVVVGMLGIMKAGGAFVPLDPQTPAERVRFVAEDAALPVLLLQSDFLFRLPPDFPCQLFALDIQLDGAEAPAAHPAPAREATDLAYVIYTSGTTGQPKGVPVTHGALANYVAWLTGATGLGEHDATALLTSHAFDLGYTGLFGSLCTGGALYVLPDDVSQAPEKGLACLVERQITFLKATPSLFYMLTHLADFARLAPELRLRWVVLGGEKIRFEDVTRFAAVAPNTKFLNHYGPTEATIGAIACPVDLGRPEAFGTNPVIGRPIAGNQVLLLDDHLRLVPPGALGEICLGGAGLARGYLNRPELTAEKFIAHPFEPGRRLYRTGDYGRWLPDGSVVFAGRHDQQVKIRGYRVETDEIRQCLKGHAAVRDALVRATGAAGGEPGLVAYVVGGETNAEALRTYLAGRLPHYMVPAFFVFLPEFPVTANGKLDARALPDPGDGERGETYQAPSTRLETQLVAIWQEVLPQQRIGVSDQFFALGGHSLIAVQLAARIHKELAVRIELKDIFENPTIAGLAGVIGGRQSGYRAIAPVEEQEVYAASHAQKRLWVLDQIGQTQVAYNRSAGYVCKGDLNAAALETAFGCLVARHEILRTTFLTHGGAVKQRVHAGSAFRLERADLSGAADLDAALQAAWEREAAKPFDLARGPLLRATLIRVDADRCVLLFTMHHIVSDAWSMGVLVKEITHFYNVAAGHPAPGPAPLGIQYKDYAAWQHAQLAGETVQKHRDYWQARFAGELPVLDLPADRLRPAVKTYAGDQVHLRFGQDLLEPLRRLNQRHETSLFMTLLAGLQALFYHYTGQTDLIIGAPAAGREHADVENQIGFYINTLAFRNELDPEAGFAAFLRRVKDTCLEAYAHQAYPFDRLVEELNLARDMSRSPLFDVMLAVQNDAAGAGEAPSLAGVKVAPFRADAAVSKYDLVFNVGEAADHLVVSLTYNTDLFSRARMERLLGHYRQLLSAALAAPDAPVRSLSWVTPAERAQLAAPAPACAYPREATLAQLFEAQVQRTPHAVAVAWGDGQLTYDALNGAANRLAHYLRDHCGIGKDDRVGLLLERSDRLVTAVLAVLKAGGAYVPIDPDYPRDRVRYTLEDAAVKALVVEASGAAQDLPAGPLVVSLREDAGRIGGCPPANLQTAPAPGDLAYIIYTSGSTGNPKGVMVEHRNVVRLLFNERFPFRFGPADVWTLFHSVCFDFSVWELFGALLYGGRLVVVPRKVTRNPGALLSLLARESVTVLNQVPSTFRQVIAALEETTPAPRLGLRYVIFGGEALRPPVLRPWYDRYPGTRLVNMYGITETTVHVTYKEIGPAEMAAGLSNIGKPIPTLRTGIVNESLQLLPPGIPGEIVVGGDGVARGYWNRDPLTRERFVPDPANPGERLYRSGDLGMQLESGDLVYLGRKDQQVKVRGFRIESGEIENALRRHPSVEAAVVALEGDADDKQLAAYLVCRREPDADALRAFLAQTLPDYMVPACFIRVEAFPLSANGKTDLKALARLNQYRLGSGIAYAAPRNALEEQLAAAWAAELKTERVGIRDNFFTLGGDSLKAIRVVAAMNARTGRAYRIEDLFRYPTLEGLSRHAGETPAGPTLRQQWERGTAILAAFRQSVLDDPDGPANLPAGWEEIYPLTPIESGMIYSSVLNPEEPVYYDQFTYKLSIADYDRFSRAFALLADRHSILRTRYYLSRFREPLKVICRDVPVPLRLEDLTPVPAEAQKAILKSYLRRDLAFRAAFDGELLWHVQVFRLAPTDYFLVWNFHHAMLDGWSISQFKADISALLAAPGAPDLAVLPPLKHSYVDYCAIVKGRQTSEETAAFWRDTLAGYTRNKLPFNYAGKPRPGHTGAAIVQTLLGAGTLGALEQLARKHQVSFKAVCLAAHLYLMHVVCAEEEVVTGVVSHDRQAIEDGDKILGCFLNTVPIRVNVAALGTNLALIRRAEELLALTRPHEIHLTDIARITGDKTSGANPIFDCILNYTDFHVLESWNDNATLERKATVLGPDPDLKGAEMTNTLFDVEVSKTLGSFRARIKYRPAYFDRADAGRALDLYQRILEYFAAEPGGALSAARLLRPEELQGPLRDLNATLTPYAAEKTLHALFEAQVRRTPDGIAVRHDGRPVRYAELNRRANQLARYLVRRGVRNNDNVGIRTERHPGMLVALLAILKAGAAYVPVDPAYPAERQEYILGNSGVQWVLADAPLAGEAAFGYVALHDPRIEAEEATDLGLAKNSRDLAYTIYTSGSTGRPKGVMIEHHSAVNLVEWVNRTFNVSSRDRLLFITSMCFDLSVYDVFGVLAAGGTVVIATQEAVQHPATLKRLLREEAITFWDSVPTTMNYLVNELEAGEGTFRQTDLRLVFLSGDWIPVQLPGRVKTYFPNAEVISLGGATEATVWSNYYPVAGTEAGRTSIPYGKPIANNFFYVLDEQANPVPPGVAGELYIGGVGVARGYANDREKTGRAFVPDPFTPLPGGTMYRTGDLGRLMADGNLEFLGRKDHQTKIRGYRVELGEIESCLGKHPAVKEAVAAVRKDAQGNNFLCAYLSVREPLSPETLRTWLAASLPAYMIPAHYVLLEALPLTPNGKIDRKALPEPQADGPDPDRYEAPATATEARIAAMWGQILGLERVSATGNLFDLGAHSLHLSAFVSRVQREMNRSLSLRDVFAQPTLRSLAALLTGREEAACRDLDPVEEQAYYRPTPAQQRFWFLHQLDPRGAAYNMPGAYLLRGKADRAALEKAFALLTARHESLRTTFVVVDGEPRQRVHAPAVSGFRVVYFDLAGQENAEETAARWAREEASRPFDLATDPPVRVMLIQLAEDRCVLLYTLHHIVSDGWSKGVFLRELLVAYAALAAGRTPDLAPLRVQYKDYAAWQNARVSGSQVAAHRAYWLSQFAEPVTPLALPADYPRPAAKSFAGAETGRVLPAALLDKLKAAGRAQEASLFMVLLAAVNALLHQLTGQQDLVVGTPTAGRDHPELDGQVGLYLNTLALRNRLRPGDTFRQVLEGAKKTALDAFEHQLYPFDQLVHELKLDRQEGRIPLFDVWMVLQNMAGDREQPPVLPGMEVVRFGNDFRVSRYDLRFTFSELSAGLRVSVNYNTDLFSAQTGERILGALAALLETVAGTPDQPIGGPAALAGPGPVPPAPGAGLRKRERGPAPAAPLVSEYVWTGDQALPYVMEACRPGVDLAQWVAAHREKIGKELLTYGAILFRNFGVRGIADFEQAVGAYGRNLLTYDFASTPRTAVKGKIYTSTEYPPDQEILMHNEMSYTNQYPAHLWFYSRQPAEQGGETPLADSRRMYAGLPPAVRERFQQEGLLYVRHYHDRLDLSWQEAFRATRREEVEAYCAARGITCAWIGDQLLQTRERCPAVRTHPVTGETVWFNQAHLFHLSSVEAALRAEIIDAVGEAHFPRNVFLGNGEKIDVSHLEAIKAHFVRTRVAFPWQQHDVVLADNLLVAHGRMPFTGRREVVVAMTD